MNIPTIQQCQDFIDGRGPSNSADSLWNALGSKLNAQQLREKAKQEAASVAAYLAAKERSKPPLSMKTTPPTPKATTPTPAAPLIRKVTASEFCGPKLVMDRAEFCKLTPQARQRFLSESGTIQ